MFISKLGITATQQPQWHQRFRRCKWRCSWWCDFLKRCTMLVQVFKLSMTAAAAAAKSLQSCPTVQPHRRQPTRLPRPWDSPGKNTGVGCCFLLQSVKSESEVTQLCPTLSNPMDRSLPGSFVHGFSRQEYWSGVPVPSPSTMVKTVQKAVRILSV